MDFHSEARIAGELLKFAMSGQLYRGSKPVMWSVVERTALAEAEVEYQDYESDTIWVKFPIRFAPGAFLCRSDSPFLKSIERAAPLSTRCTGYGWRGGVSSGRPRPGRSPATGR